jgi:hypothetical protein
MLCLHLPGQCGSLTVRAMRWVNLNFLSTSLSSKDTGIGSDFATTKISVDFSPFAP